MGVWWEIPTRRGPRFIDWGASMTVIFKGFNVVSDDVSRRCSWGLPHRRCQR